MPSDDASDLVAHAPLPPRVWSPVFSGVGGSSSGQRGPDRATDPTGTKLCFIDTDFIVRWANQASLASMSSGGVACLGRPCYEMVAGRPEVCEGCPNRTVLESGVPVREEGGTPDGRTWSVYREPIYSAEGALEGVLVSATDVSPYKRLMTSLRDSEHRGRLAFEHAAFGMALQDLTGRFLRVNDRLCDLVGYSRSELLTMRCSDLEHPDDRHLGRGDAERMLRGELAQAGVDKRLVTRDGRAVWTRITASPARPERKTRYLVCVMDDISEQKALEEERLRLVDELKRSNNELGRYAQVVAHELRAPLANLRLSLQILSDTPDDGLSGELKSEVSRLEGIAARMNEIVDGMLSAARVRSEEHGDKIPWADASEALAAACALLRPEIQRRDARVEAGDLPHVRVEPGHLVQIMVNLVGNAIRHGGRDGLRILVTASRRDGRWFVRVEDDGMGLQQTASTGTAGGGLGLGIVRDLLALYGGSLETGTTASGGAVVTISLPDG
ncbi:MAG: PAS domain S-box protein [Armatimonadia bacterium]|nr:PAS domain S-box protein [Armatimonadia bacterium]